MSPALRHKVGVVAFPLLVCLGLFAKHAQGSDPAPIVNGCVIRFVHQMPQIHANSTHACTSVTKLGLSDAGDLLIYRTFPQGSRIMSVTAAIDESFASRDILAGASGGGKVTTVRLYRDRVHLRADTWQVRCSVCNLWMTWVEVPGS